MAAAGLSNANPGIATTPPRHLLFASTTCCLSYCKAIKACESKDQQHAPVCDDFEKIYQKVLNTIDHCRWKRYASIELQQDKDRTATAHARISVDAYSSKVFLLLIFFSFQALSKGEAGQEGHLPPSLEFEKMSYAAVRQNTLKIMFCSLLMYSLYKMT